MEEKGIKIKVRDAETGKIVILETNKVLTVEHLINELANILKRPPKYYSLRLGRCILPMNLQLIYLNIPEEEFLELIPDPAGGGAGIVVTEIIFPIFCGILAEYFYRRLSEMYIKKMLKRKIKREVKRRELSYFYDKESKITDLFVKDLKTWLDIGGVDALKLFYEMLRNPSTIELDRIRELFEDDNNLCNLIMTLSKNGVIDVYLRINESRYYRI